MSRSTQRTHRTPGTHRTTLGSAARLAGALGLCLVACAAGRKESEPPADPSASKNQAEASGQAAQSRPATSDGAEPPASAGAAGAPADPRAAQVQAQARDLDRFEAELQKAGGECREACRALGSMDRACGGLCSLSRGTNDAPLCSSATRRLQNARDSVKRACGACPNGASVERFAPIPSVP